MTGRREILAARPVPGDRAAEPPGGLEDDEILHVRADLPAEAAADVGRDHPQQRLRHPGRPSELVTHDLRSLRRGPDRVAVALRGGHDAAGFHGRGRNARKGEPTAYDDIRAGEGGRDIAVRPFLGEADVPLDCVMHAYGRAECRRCVADDRQRFVVDLDHRQRIDRSCLVDSDDGRDGLTGEPDDVDRHGLVLGRPLAAHGGDQAATLEPKILTGQDGHDARRGGRLADVEMEQAAMGDGAAEEGEVQCSGRPDARRPGRPTGDQVVVLLASDRVADHGSDPSPSAPTALDGCAWS